MAYVDDAWRAPGCIWRKTENGWKIVNDVVIRKPKEQSPFLKKNTDQIKGKDQSRCISILKNSRELSCYRSLGDVMDKLDLNEALHDYDRFLYVCKIIEEIAAYKLTSLGNSSQKYLRNLIDDAVKLALQWHDFRFHVKKLLRITTEAIERNYYQLIGSLSIWQARLQHFHDCELILTEEDKVVNYSKTNPLRFMDIPDDCIRHILPYLSNFRDLIALSMVNKRLNYLANESYVWRNLCQYHFKEEEIEKYSKKDCSYKVLFKYLYKRYGIREEQPYQSLYLCEQCGFVYWQKYGHPCSSIVNFSDICAPLSPKKLISLFST